MIADQSRLETLLREGDYFEALGVHPDSSVTDIAVAAARLAGEHPSEARRINAVASVLRDPAQREIYLIAAEERDNVMRRALEPQLRSALPDLRRRVWTELQRLLRCEFELGVVKIGPRGARSLAQRHEWIREAVVNANFPVLAPSPAERQVGVVYCTLMVTDCPKCGGLARETCDCKDEYRFDIPSHAPSGTLLGAYGERTGRFQYMILDRPVLAPRPQRTVNLLYQAHLPVGRLGNVGDFTVEEARAWIRRQFATIAIGYAFFGALLGLFVSSWATGAVTAVTGLAVAAARFATAYTRKRAWIFLGAIMVIQPAAGALVGGVLATTTSGLVTGVVLSLILFLGMLFSPRLVT